MISLPEMVWYEIMEHIYSCPYQQDNRDVYVVPRVFDVLKKHPKVMSTEEAGEIEELTRRYPGFEIGGKYFMIYPDCPSDFQWFVYKHDSDQDLTVTEMNGKIKCV